MYIYVCIHSCQNTNTNNTYIYNKSTNLQTRGKGGKILIKKAINKTTKNLQGQSTPMGQQQTQNLEFNRIKTIFTLKKQ